MGQTIVLVSIAVIPMSNNVDAAAKDAEGRLESAIGDLTGDKGHQIKGKAKQVQASAMNVAEDLKQAAQSVAENVSHAADNAADHLS
ncbi:MAG: CsbD family protein [Cyanobacteriota bacterium]